MSALRPAFIIAAAFLFPRTAFARDDGQVEQPHARVEFRGIEKSYAQAIARLVEAARETYITDFAFDLPDRISVFIECAPDQSNRLWTDGQDRVTLTLSSPLRLRKPADSGVFNIYGFCHELGHMAMYRTLQNRDWLAGDAAEGWAHFTGSVVVDRVYESLGAEFWPDRYDYRQDGLARLEKQRARKKPDAVTAAAGQWRKLDKLVGRKKLVDLFRAWNAADIQSTDPAPALRTALHKFAAPVDADAWFEDFAQSCVVKIESSRHRKRTIRAEKLSRQPVMMKYDDGTPEGKKSIAGGGHAVFFDAPADCMYLTRVDVFAARYGTPQAPKESFTLTLCDGDLKPIANWKKPYSTFERGEPSWVEISVTPTAVPRRFAVCFDFDPTATKGVFVHRDDSTKGHSATGLPGRKPAPLEEGDWMIRVQLDTPKSADALQGEGGT